MMEKIKGFFNKIKNAIDWKRLNWKRVIPLLVLIFLIFYLLISLIVGLLTKKPTPEIYKICNLNSKKTLQVIQKEDRNNPVVLNDYNFYGESINLYYKSYDRNMPSSDTLGGEMLALVDLCTGTETKFDITDKVDGGIQISQLKDGFYSVYSVVNENYRRVYMPTNIYVNNTAYSVTRDGKRIKAELIANTAQFDAEGQTESVLDRSYLYIKVTSEEVTEATIDYDVAIITAPALLQTNVSLDGEHANGIIEGVELWAVAETVRDKLEAEGLKVRIAKDAHNEQILYYGEGGLANRIYSGNNKYAIMLDMTTANSEVNAIYSAYSSDKFAAPMYRRLAELGFYKEDGSQLKASSSATSKDDGTRYDSDWEVRELGGKVLGAGSYSETSRKNASFSADSIFGVNAVKLTVLNIKDAEAVGRWKESRDAIANAIAEGILETIKGVKEDTGNK